MRRSDRFVTLWVTIVPDGHDFWVHFSKVGWETTTYTSKLVSKVDRNTLRASERLVFTKIGCHDNYKTM